MRPPVGKTSRFGAKGSILLLGFFTFFCGFISVFLSVLRLQDAGAVDRYYSVLLSPLGVSFYGMGTLRGPYLSLSFYLLLLVGCILFMVNRKEVRLIRFTAAVLLFDRVLGICSLLAGGFRIVERDEVVAVYVMPFVWLGAAIYLLRATREGRQLAVYRAVGEERGVFVKSAKGMRLLHLLFDLAVCWLLFFDQGPVFGEEGWHKLVHAFGLRGALVLYFLVFRVGYYLFFEAIWGATPGKYLTGARVTDFYGERVVFGRVVVRTLSRLAPFEVFSFWGEREGWHDRWSRTFVLQETTDGVDEVGGEPMPFAGQPQRPGLIGASFEGS
ncbi:MAG: RDD family protein [Bacteroidetes bacterium]|nr:RDD family protein [Bacteroidota bacterium]